MAINLNFFTMYGTFVSNGPNADVNTANYSSTFQTSLLKTANDADLPVQFSTNTVFKLLLSLMNDPVAQQYIQYYMFGQPGSLSTVMGSYIYNGSNYALPSSVAVMNLMKDSLNGTNTNTSATNMLSALNSVVVVDAQKSIYDSSKTTGKYDVALGNTIKDMFTAVLNSTDDTYNVVGSSAYNLRSALTTYSNIDVAGIINQLIRGTVASPVYTGTTAEAIKTLLSAMFSGLDTSTSTTSLLSAINQYIAKQIFSTDTNIVDAIQDVSLNGNMVNPCYYMFGNMKYVKSTYSDSADLSPQVGPLFNEAASGSPTVSLNSAMMQFSGLVASNDSSLYQSGKNSKSVITNDFVNSNPLSVAGYGINTMSFAGSQASLSLKVYQRLSTTLVNIDASSDKNNVKVGGLPGGAVLNGTNGAFLRNVINASATPYLLFSKQTYGGNDYRIFIHQTQLQNKLVETVYIFHTNGLLVMTGEGTVLNIGKQKTWMKQGLSSSIEQLTVSPYQLGIEVARSVGTGNTQSLYQTNGSLCSTIIATAGSMANITTPARSQSFNLFGQEIAINGSSTNTVVMSDAYTDSAVAAGETYLFRGIKDLDSNGQARYFIQILFNMSTGKVDNVKLVSADASSLDEYDLIRTS